MDGFISRIEMTEERDSKVKDRSLEIIQSKEEIENN